MLISLHLFSFSSLMTITTDIVVVFIIIIIIIIIITIIIIIITIAIIVKEPYPQSENSLTGDDGTKPLSYNFPGAPLIIALVFVYTGPRV